MSKLGKKISVTMAYGFSTEYINKCEVNYNGKTLKGKINTSLGNSSDDGGLAY
jgi:hypothetical protein